MVAYGMTTTIGTAARRAIRRTTPVGYSPGAVGGTRCHPRGDLAAIDEAELREDVLYVVLRGALGDVQFCGDLTVGHAARHAGSDLPLARGQRLTRVSEGRCEPGQLCAHRSHSHRV